MPNRDPTDLDFSGHAILITGSNTGIGKEAAIKVARQNAAHVIIAVRTVSKGEAVVPLVRAAATDPKCKIEVWELEMEDYDSIKALVRRADIELENGLQGAILNAGLLRSQHFESRYHWEQGLQVNAISTILLALMLIPVMRKTKTVSFKPSLVIVNSSGHRTFRLSERQQQGKEPILMNLNAGFVIPRQYAGAKLLSMYACRHLAQVAGEDIYIVNVCPGAVQTDIVRDAGRLIISAMSVFAPLYIKTAEEGSRTLVSALGLTDNIAERGELWQGDVKVE